MGLFFPSGEEANAIHRPLMLVDDENGVVQDSSSDSAVEEDGPPFLDVVFIRVVSRVDGSPSSDRGR